MDIDNFIRHRPDLYHLTSKDNITNILLTGELYSTKRIVELTNPLMPDKILKSKRLKHQRISHNGITFDLRDQKPISEKLLKGCLTNGMTCEQYYIYLNERIFFWPNLIRLKRHFKRYRDEQPQIIRVDTSEIIALNPQVKFSRLNSGALRANFHLGGKAPKRGNDTFTNADGFQYGVGDVAEVTFENQCILPKTIYISNHPMGRWTKYEL